MGFSRSTKYLSNVIIVFAVLVIFNVGTLIGTLQHQGHRTLPIQTATTEEIHVPLVNIAKRQKMTTESYEPSSLESYFFDHAVELGFNEVNPMPKVCQSWLNETSPVYEQLHRYREEYHDYRNRMRTFKSPVEDLRTFLEEDPTICDSLELHRDGLPGIFSSESLSKTIHGGFIEPIAPPFRDPAICFSKIEDIDKNALSLRYLVHDFAAMCRKLTPRSQIVFVDIGASLDFHLPVGDAEPSLQVISRFQQFGFLFDHIYAYEMEPSKASDVFEKIPDDILAAYHWMNVGVSLEHDAKMNPWRLLLENFDEHDFVIVKLDIDTPEVGRSLANQLLHTPGLSKIIDIFYFEHRVHLDELGTTWGTTMEGTVQDSMDLFLKIRETGIDAHFWV